MIIIAVVAVAGLAYYTQPFKTMSSDVANGKIKYQQNCVSCHGEKGYGDGVLATTFEEDNRPSDINTKFKKSWKPDNRLARRILVGKPDTGMPAFKGSLSEKDAEDVMAYLRTVD